ncbi:MAG: methyltransferase domain-containing protein [Magnetospirillum sp.]|nr:methyltransferase domain-containing protein [Magnetospirillum sp.]
MTTHHIHSCDLCGADDAAEIECSRFYTDGQPIHVCRQCGFVFVRARRSIEDIARAWSEECYGKTYTARTPHMLARQSFVTQFIADAVGFGGKALVDIGAGEGQFFELLRRFDHKPSSMLGIEPSPDNCRLLEGQGFAAFAGTIEDYLADSTAGGARFDLATIMWTLENTTDCRGMLKGAHGLLKEGGHVVVATGSRILVPFKKPLGYYFTKVPADTCNFRVSARTLKGLLAVSGFVVEHENRWIDNDFLVMVARKARPGESPQWQGDDSDAVLDFFARWHQDTQAHFKDC